MAIGCAVDAWVAVAVELGVAAAVAVGAAAVAVGAAAVAVGAAAVAVGAAAVAVGAAVIAVVAIGLGVGAAVGGFAASCMTLKDAVAVIPDPDAPRWPGAKVPAATAST